MPPSPEKRPPIGALTGLRFLAALHVVFFHYFPVSDDWPTLGSIVKSGNLGVPLFYVLSGFVLYYNYGNTHIDRGKFWTNRFCRIYPVYFFAFLAAATYAPANIYQAWGSVARVVEFGVLNILLLQAWHPASAMSWNAPSWSLSVEAFFYAVFPAIAIYLNRRNKSSLQRDLVLLCAATFLIPVASALVPDLWRWVRYCPVSLLTMFAVGAVLAAVFLLRPGTPPRAQRLDAAVISTLLAIVGLFAVNRFLSLPLSSALVLPLFATLVYCLAVGTSFVSRFLALPGMVLLGEASYSVYILQEPWRSLAERIFPPEFLVSLTGFCVYTLILIAISISSFFWIEKPMRRWLRDRLLRKPAARVALSAD